jgi:hypothetical protein
VSKFNTVTPELRYLERFDVIFAQETYTTSPENGFDLEGYIPYHVLARQTTRKPSWGLSTLVKISTFVGGTLSPIPSPLDWLQVTRWKWPNDRGVLLINAYVAVHTAGFDVNEVRAAVSFLQCLRSDFPADKAILGGDLNVDIWRLREHRLQGVSIPTKTRLAESFFIALRDDLELVHYPPSRLITYDDGGSKSALDYWSVSSDIRVFSTTTGPFNSAQHLPLELHAGFEIEIGQFLLLQTRLFPFPFDSHLWFFLR